MATPACQSYEGKKYFVRKASVFGLGRQYSVRVMAYGGVIRVENPRRGNKKSLSGRDEQSLTLEMIWIYKP